jgi:hypothetical protein
VVYLAECLACGLQGVGSTVNFKASTTQQHSKYHDY